MIIFEYGKEFDRDTVEPTGVQIKEKNHHCDWTGEKIEDLDLEQKPYEQYILDYGMEDPCYGVGPEKFDNFLLEDIRPFDLLNCNSGGTYLYASDVKSVVLEKFIDGFKSGKWNSFGGFLRWMRCETVKDLLSSDEFQPWNFPGFCFPPEEMSSYEEWKNFKEEYDPSEEDSQ